MAEIWSGAGAAIISSGANLLGGVLGGIGAQKKAKKDAAFKAAEDRALMSDEAKYSAVNQLFKSQLDDYNNQLQRLRKQRGLDQFRGFSTLQNYAPGYAEGQGIVLPEQPNMGAYNTLISTAEMSKPTKY